MCVTNEINQNLMPNQKLLLKWHFNLGHIEFEKLLALARCNLFPVWLKSCQPPLCASCWYGAAMRRPTGSEKHLQDPQAEGGHGQIKAGDLIPGQCISVDSYISKVHGCLTTSQGRTLEESMYMGGTIFINHASGLIRVKNQTLLMAVETLHAKCLFERFAQEHNV